jgi:hypothetical protein
VPESNLLKNKNAHNTSHVSFIFLERERSLNTLQDAKAPRIEISIIAVTKETRHSTLLQIHFVFHNSKQQKS